MTFDKRQAAQRAAALIGDTAALIVLDQLIVKMRNRAMMPSATGPTSRHPWLMAVVVEGVAQFGDAIVFQRRRAAAAIDRAVAAQHLPAMPASAPAAGAGNTVPAARTGRPMPVTRADNQHKQL